MVHEGDSVGDKVGEKIGQVVGEEVEHKVGNSSSEGTVGQINQKPRRKYWATRSSVRSFARTAHLFACSGLLASLAPSAALTRSRPPLHSLVCSLIHFAHSLAHGIGVFCMK